MKKINKVSIGDAVVIARYTRKEMAKIWEPEARFRYMLDVEKAVARVQAGLGIIPRKASADIQKKSKFKIERISISKKKQSMTLLHLFLRSLKTLARMVSLFIMA